MTEFKKICTSEIESKLNNIKSDSLLLECFIYVKNDEEKVYLLADNYRKHTKVSAEISLCEPGPEIGYEYLISVTCEVGRSVMEVHTKLNGIYLIAHNLNAEIESWELNLNSVS